ncbi:MAG: fasciclin domain-containing protein [Chitinophagaceae bacterium]|nr:fasciclin domain-containing protein [Chitinophagaceae bacterium]
MKTRKYTGLLLPVVISSALFTSCKHEDLAVSKPNENVRTAGDFIKNNYDFSLFYAALDYTGLIRQLNEKGPFTVLAPANKAFMELGIQTAADVQRLNRDSLKQAMAFHILTRRLMQADVPVNGVDIEYETLAGIPLYATFACYAPGNSAYSYDKLYFSGSFAYRKDVQLANGVLHALVKVMKQYPGKTVRQWLADRPDYSIFVSGLKKFGLWDELAGDGPFTIFAPDNKAFTDAGISQAVVDDLETDKYIGQRLFGAYILYKKRYFLADKILFNIVNGEASYLTTIRNDQAVFGWYDYQGDYNLSLTSGRIQPIIYYGSVDVPGALGYRLDHLCSNGIVHDTPGLLIKPEQALK